MMGRPPGARRCWPALRGRARRLPGAWSDAVVTGSLWGADAAISWLSNLQARLDAAYLARNLAFEFYDWGRIGMQFFTISWIRIIPPRITEYILWINSDIECIK